MQIQPFASDQASHDTPQPCRFEKLDPWTRLALTLKIIGIALLIFPLFFHENRSQLSTWINEVWSGQRKITLILTRTNLPKQMQQVICDYYDRPYPHFQQITVFYNGIKRFWKDLTAKEKYHVLDMHAHFDGSSYIPKRNPAEEESVWNSKLDGALLKGSHEKNGQPVKLRKDPRQWHGSDHAMRVAIFSAVYAYLYNKYDSRVHLKDEDLLIIQLTGACDDGGRQADGVDIDDHTSAQISKDLLKQLGVSEESYNRSFEAIISKNDTNLTKKHLFAKCIQCANSLEFGRFGTFDKRYLNIHQEFTGEYPKKIHAVHIKTNPKVLLKPKKTLAEFNQEMDALNKEMLAFVEMTTRAETRSSFSESGKNYYSEMLHQIDQNRFPHLQAVLHNLKILMP